MKVDEFWVWFQSILGKYLNREVKTIQPRSYELKQVTRIQFSYLQWATQFLVQTTLEVRTEIQNALKEVKTPPSDDAMEWEWIPITHEWLPDLEADLQAKLANKTFTQKEEDSEDEQDRRDRRCLKGTQPPPVPSSSLGTTKSNKPNRTWKMSLGARGNRPPSPPPTVGRGQGGDPDCLDGDSSSDDDGRLP